MHFADNPQYLELLQKLRSGQPASQEDIDTCLQRCGGGCSWNCASVAQYYLEFYGPILLRQPEMIERYLPTIISPLYALGIESLEDYFDMMDTLGNKLQCNDEQTRTGISGKLFRFLRTPIKIQRPTQAELDRSNCRYEIIREIQNFMDFLRSNPSFLEESIQSAALEMGS